MTHVSETFATHSAATSDAAVAAKAAVLSEALPWLERFAGSTVVIKYGGNAMADPMAQANLQEAFASDVVFLRRVGLRPVVVHGGGPQISSMLERLAITSEFIDGLRVTSPEAMDVVRMVLTGQVQRDIVGLINRHGALAVGMSGEDAHLFTATRLVGESGEVDWGQVGVLTDVDPSFVRTVLDDGLIPVVSSIARGVDGSPFNVNADSAAAALATALHARKLVMLTDVPGVYAQWPDTSSVISELTASQLRELLPTVSSGMIPKLGACLEAVSAGVAQAHILDGRRMHAILLEIFTDEGVGTLVVQDGEPS
jgi:acetylglutamate kinase